MWNQIETCRMKIDEIDDELLRLLNERTKLVAELGLIKKRHAMPVRDHIREVIVLMRVREKNCGPLDDDAASRIFQSIIRESCRTQASAREMDATVLKRNY